VPEEQSAEAAPEWSAEDIAVRVEEARTLAASGHGEAALLLAWSTCEAAARALASSEQLDAQRWNPGALFRQLVHAGLLDNDDLQTIESARLVRNRLSHGLLASGEPTDIALRLAQVAENLLQELGLADGAGVDG
jgi:hypothetical protein